MTIRKLIRPVVKVAIRIADRHFCQLTTTEISVLAFVVFGFGLITAFSGH